MKRMLPLKALRPHLYGTRRLEAGDEYEAPVEEAIAQVATRKADFAKGKKQATPVPATKPPEPAKREPEPPQQPDHRVGAMMSDAAIEQLRLEATQLGIEVDGRWGVPRLRHEIEIAQAKR